MISVFSAEYPAQGATKTVQGLPWEARLSRPALKGNLAELRVTLTAGGIGLFSGPYQGRKRFSSKPNLKPRRSRAGPCTTDI